MTAVKGPVAGAGDPLAAAQRSATARLGPIGIRNAGAAYSVVSAAARKWSTRASV
jgi:hypothetical protein